MQSVFTSNVCKKLLFDCTCKLACTCNSRFKWSHYLLVFDVHGRHTCSKCLHVQLKAHLSNICWWSLVYLRVNMQTGISTTCSHTYQLWCSIFGTDWVYSSTRVSQVFAMDNRYCTRDRGHNQTPSGWLGEGCSQKEKLWGLMDFADWRCVKCSKAILDRNPMLDATQVHLCDIFYHKETASIFYFYAQCWLELWALSSTEIHEPWSTESGSWTTTARQLAEKSNRFSANKSAILALFDEHDRSLS